MKNKLKWIVGILAAAGLLTAFISVKCAPGYTEVIPLATQYDDALFSESCGSVIYEDSPEYTGYLMLFDCQSCTVSGVTVQFERLDAHVLYFLGDGYEVLKKVSVRGGIRTVKTDPRMKGLAFSVRDEELGTVSVKVQTVDKTAGNLSCPTVSIIGDSMSAYEWTIPKNYSPYYPSGDVGIGDMWWNLAAGQLGMRILINNSCSGSGVSELIYDGISEEHAACNGRGKRLSLLGEKPEQIWVMIGGNDILMDADHLTVDRAYRAMMEDIKHTYPEAGITLVATFHEKVLRQEEFAWLRQEIERIADAYGCGFVSLADCGISTENAAETLYDYDGSTGTGIHPNKAGMQLMAEEFVRQYKGEAK